MRRDLLWYVGTVVFLAACGRPAGGPTPITGARFLAASANGERLPARNELLSTTPIVLRPTVDSAAPQVTTWQSDDTLRLYVPWQRVLGPRWLVLTASYRTLSHNGNRGECSGRMGTDTLRFRGEP